MYSVEGHSRKFSVAWVTTISLAVVGVFGFAMMSYMTHKGQAAPEKPLVLAETAIRSAETPSKLTSSMMVVGELFWGRGIDMIAGRSTLKHQHPFKGFNTEMHNKYDNWIADMECPVTTTDIPYQTQVDRLQFNCRPEYLPEAAKWFDAFTLANNHMCDNRGETGQNETRTNLEIAKIQYFGDCKPANNDDICEVISLKATVTMGSTKTNTRIPVAMCGYMYVVNVAPKEAELAVMKKYSAVMPVIAMPHSGVEYRATAETAKETSYRRMIDAGADVVLGAHPHVIQNSENYKGKLIQYSSGNFMFDQQSLERDNIISLGVGLNLEINDQAAIKVYQSLGSECAKHKDDCLQKLQSLLKSRPQIKVSYTPGCFTEPDYYPKVADTATCDEILRQATWQTATADLATTW